MNEIKIFLFEEEANLKVNFHCVHLRFAIEIDDSLAVDWINCCLQLFTFLKST